MPRKFQNFLLLSIFFFVVPFGVGCGQDTESRQCVFCDDLDESPVEIGGPGVAEDPENGDQPVDPASCRAIGPQVELDLSVVEVSGTVTRNGSALSGSIAEDAAMVFTDVETEHEYKFHLESGFYQGTLFASTYRVRFVGLERGQCSRRCNAIEDLGEVRIDESRTFDLDLTMVEVAGHVTLDGATPAPDPDDREPRYLRGRVIFVDRSTERRWPAQLASAGQASFALALPLGDYDVWWHAQYSSSRASDDEPWPRGSAYLGRVQITRAVDGLRFDARSVKVSGEVYLGNAPIPDDSLGPNGERASIKFLPTGTYGSNVTYGLGEFGPARYEAWLFEGTYDIEIRSGHSGSQNALTPGTEKNLCPEDGCRLEEAAMRLDVRLDEDTFGSPRSRLSGRVNFTGALAGFDCRWGGLTFEPTGRGQQEWTRVWEDGEWEVELNPGIYQVFYRGDRRKECGDERAQGATMVEEALVVDGDRPGIEWSAATVKISGEITLEGQVMPDDDVEEFEDPRGMFELEHPQTGEVVQVSLGKSGPATYTANVLAGGYDARVASFLSSRGIRRFEQDVLPRGARELGPIEIRGQDLRADYDLSTASISGVLALGGAAVTADYDLPNQLIFTNVADGHTTAVETDKNGGPFELLLYEGGYYVEAARAARGVSRDCGPARDDVCGPWGRTRIGSCILVQ